MSVTAYLTWLGHPIAYYPALARALGGVNPAVFACQLLYWQTTPIGDPPRSPHREEANAREVYKTAEEWESETGLSEEEQRTARRKLASLCVLHERYERLHHRMYYRIDFDALDLLVSIGNLTKPGIPTSGSRESQGGEVGNSDTARSGLSGSSNTETTSKTTTPLIDGSCDDVGKALPWPPGLDPDEQDRCNQVLREFPHDVRCQFLAALANAMSCKRLKKAPHQYLAGCAKKYSDGKFTLLPAARQETAAEQHARLTREKRFVLAREVATHESAAATYLRAGDTAAAELSRLAAAKARDELNHVTPPPA